MDMENELKDAEMASKIAYHRAQTRYYEKQYSQNNNWILIVALCLIGYCLIIFTVKMLEKSRDVQIIQPATTESESESPVIQEKTYQIHLQEDKPAAKPVKPLVKVDCCCTHCVKHPIDETNPYM